MLTVDPPSYEFHEPKFWGSRRICCSLEASELVVEVEGKPPVRVLYQDITVVHLSSRAHGRNEAVMDVRDFRCQVIARRRSVEITNRSDRGVGRRYVYENQAFNTFVRELHRRLLPFQERVQFRAGHSLYFWLAVGAGALTAILAPFRLASYDGHLAVGIGIYLSAVTGLIVAAYRLRPSSYAPTRIPEGLLPAGEDRRGFMA